jgi:hypothetical protein
MLQTVKYKQEEFYYKVTGKPAYILFNKLYEAGKVKDHGAYWNWAVYKGLYFYVHYEDYKDGYCLLHEDVEIICVVNLVSEFDFMEEVIGE